MGKIPKRRLENPLMRIHKDMEDTINKYFDIIKEVNPEIKKTTATQHLSIILEKNLLGIQNIKNVEINNKKKAGPSKRKKIVFGDWEFEI